MSALPELSQRNAVLFVFLGGMLAFLSRLYSTRSKFVRLRRQGLALPKYSPVFGHLPLAKQIMSTLPRDVHGHALVDQIKRADPDLGSIFYLDTWPFSDPIVVVTSPSGVHQMAQKPLLKPRNLSMLLRPIAGGENISTMEGQLWKTWRNVLNPAFSTMHLASLVPDMVQEIMVFCDILREHAERKEAFYFEEMATNLTLDIAGKAVIDKSLNSQRSDNEVKFALRNAVKSAVFADSLSPLQLIFHPIRPFAQWYYSRRLSRYFSREFDKRLYSSKPIEPIEKSKSVLDIILKSNLAQKESTNSMFRTFAIRNIRQFMFSAHDTTSSTLCYTMYLLATNPVTREKVRAEQDSVLGTNLNKAKDSIVKDPSILNRLPYANAVIKETLRLFPPAGTARAGSRDFVLTDDGGHQYPTEGCLIYAPHQLLHRNPSYWPQPDVFLPERWLVPSGDPLYPMKDAWRPFEFGPRNCIGQEMALLEIRLVVALTLREFDIYPVYEEIDRLSPRKGPKSHNGNRAYQISLGAAHPNGKLPCRVKSARR